jgi:Rrf2 family protein
MVGVNQTARFMFRLSKKADYGLIALKHLARHADESVSAREIAREYRIPGELLAKIMQRLARKGLVVSQQGTHGGYLLGRDPSRISIVDVIEALDGPIGITPCERGSNCEQLEKCSVKDPLMAVRAKMVRVLGDTSIYELAG